MSVVAANGRSTRCTKFQTAFNEARSTKHPLTTAISIENVSKQYRLGQVGTGTIAHDLNRWWARVRGKDDPFATVGQVNDRTIAVSKNQAPGTRNSDASNYVWALKDINLQVEQGQILGIIGRNGAGKSTLLKLLSRVTAPTTGRIRVRGRMASLLEVGTGFHPELTGRENIYLNGAILGMTRAEIRKRFDEIVDFSGCAKYIDTPVKRYSSGMYVRLAFAVAAHLEPEILIVDEVLAVGDADFQAKCLGKMSEVSREHGRTILFVSHNMGAIKQLCPNSVLMKHGAIAEIGGSQSVVSAYMRGECESLRQRFFDDEKSANSNEVQLHEISICDPDGSVDSAIATDSPLEIRIRYSVRKAIHNLRVAVLLMTGDGTEVLSTSDLMDPSAGSLRGPGEYCSTCYLPSKLLNRINYVVAVDFDVPCVRSVLPQHHVEFQVTELTVNQLGRTNAPAPSGVVHPLLNWNVSKLEGAAVVPETVHNA